VKDVDRTFVGVARAQQLHPHCRQLFGLLRLQKLGKAFQLFSLATSAAQLLFVDDLAAAFVLQLGKAVAFLAQHGRQGDHDQQHADKPHREQRPQRAHQGDQRVGDERQETHDAPLKP